MLPGWAMSDDEAAERLNVPTFVGHYYGPGTKPDTIRVWRLSAETEDIRNTSPSSYSATPCLRKISGPACIGEGQAQARSARGETSISVRGGLASDALLPCPALFRGLETGSSECL